MRNKFIKKAFFILLGLSLMAFASAQDSLLTSHILDITKGVPVKSVKVALEKRDGDGVWTKIQDVVTNSDGRVSFTDLKGNDLKNLGVYRLVFYTKEYFEKEGLTTFYPEIDVIFEIDNVDSHYHVPITLSPFGYSTYRGS